MLAQTDFPASVGIRKILSKINFSLHSKRFLARFVQKAGARAKKKFNLFFGFRSNFRAINSIGNACYAGQINFVDWPGSVTDGIVFYFSHNLVVCVRPPEIPFPLLSLTRESSQLNCSGKEGQNNAIRKVYQPKRTTSIGKCQNWDNRCLTL